MSITKIPTTLYYLLPIIPVLTGYKIVPVLVGSLYAHYTDINDYLIVHSW